MSLRGMYADIADNTVGVMHMTTSFTSTRDLRYPAPDIARGLMLLLIAMANVPVWVAKNLPTGTGARFHPSMADSAWLFIRMLFVDHRVYPLFAMLFGFGLMTMINRRIAGGTQTFLASLPGIESGREPTPQEEAWARERATVHARRLVRRRGWWMLLFGFVHGIVFPGDIIGTYGLVAVLLAGWLARKQFRQLVVAGTIATLTEIALLLMIGFLSQGESTTGAGGATTSEQVLLPWFITNPGSWAVQTLMGAVGLILLAVVIGARLADTDLIVHPERHRSLLVVVAVGGLLLGALGALPMTLAQMGMMSMPLWSTAAQNVFGLAQVVFVPTWAQPFKKGRRVTPAEHRYLMTVIATASNNRFTVSRVDIDRGGTTYTIDTLHDIAAEYPGAELYFITGADALAQILTWKDNEEIFGLAHLVGVTRPGHALTDGGLPADRVSLVEVPAMAISSTDCRERVGRGASVWYLVPDGVVQYIRKYGLYRVTQRQASTTSMTARVAREQSLRKENDGE